MVIFLHGNFSSTFLPPVLFRLWPATAPLFAFHPHRTPKIMKAARAQPRGECLSEAVSSYVRDLPPLTSLPSSPALSSPITRAGCMRPALKSSLAFVAHRQRAIFRSEEFFFWWLFASSSCSSGRAFHSTSALGKFVRVRWQLEFQPEVVGKFFAPLSSFFFKARHAG